MTLPVRIEAKAWTDSRYATVALYLGLPAGDSEVALIRCAAIWRWQTEHYTEAAPTYVVPEGVVIGALKSLDGPRALVAAGLAELVDGGLRIKGGRNDKGESRIDWYWRDQQQRKSAGHASESRRGTGGRFGSARSAESPATTDARPTDHRRSTDGPPTLDPPRTDSPDSDLRTPDPEISLSAGAREACQPASQPTNVQSMAEAFRTRVDCVRAELQTELDVPFPGGSYADRKTEAEIGTVALGLVLAWIRSASGQDPARVVRERVEHLIAIRSAVARHRRSLDWWAPGNFWKPDGIGKDMDRRTPADAVRALSERAGPRPPATPVQQRRAPIRDLAAPVRRSDP